MIEIERVEKTYEEGALRTDVLKGLDFRVAHGEFVAIMGASGRGKTTLMNLLGCLDRPTRGHYRLDGHDVGGLDDDALSRLRNRKIGFVFQQFHLLERATALRNVMLPLVYRDEEPGDPANLARAALERVALADRVAHRPGQMSGGQQQRVAIARALVTDPALILADEPTGNLDVRNGAEVLAVFQKLHREGKTLILVTHDPAVAEHAGRVIVLADGRISEDRRVERPRSAEAEFREFGARATTPS
jgi:putative ABC transport system ATP-binding protein